MFRTAVRGRFWRSEGLSTEDIGTALITIEPVMTLPDDVNGRAIADFPGPADLRAIEPPEVDFIGRPEAR